MKLLCSITLTFKYYFDYVQMKNKMAEDRITQFLTRLYPDSITGTLL